MNSADRSLAVIVYEEDSHLLLYYLIMILLCHPKR